MSIRPSVVHISFPDDGRAAPPPDAFIRETTGRTAHARRGCRTLLELQQSPGRRKSFTVDWIQFGFVDARAGDSW